MVIYEHLTTFKYEVDFLYSRRKSAATWIFLFNRYLLIANALFSIAPVSPRVSDTFDAHKFAADVVHLAVSTHNSCSVCAPDVGTRSCNNSLAVSSLNFLTVTMQDIPLHGMYLHMEQC